MTKTRLDPTAKPAEALEQSKQKLIDAVKKSREKNRRERLNELSSRKIKQLEIKQMQPEYKLKEEDSVGRPAKITPEMEKLLFAYFTAGASLRSIHLRFGKEMGFSYAALTNARDFYKWEDRCSAIRNVIMNDNTINVANRYVDYMQFLDDLISEGMIRFSGNVESGKTKSPFETLKISNVKDLRDAITTFVELSHGGVRRHEIKQQLEHNVKISDDKAAKILEILADKQIENTGE